MEIKRPHTPPPRSRSQAADPRSSNGATVPQTQPGPQPPRADASSSVRPANTGASLMTRVRSYMVGAPNLPRLPGPSRWSDSQPEGGHGTGNPDAQPQGSRSRRDESLGGFWTEEDMARNSRLTTQVDPEELFRLPQPSTPAPRTGRIFGKVKTLVSSKGGSKDKPSPGEQVGMLLAGLETRTFGTAGGAFPNRSLNELRESIGGNDAKKRSEFVRLTQEQLNHMRIADLETLHDAAAAECNKPDFDPFVALVRDMAAVTLRNYNPALSPVLQKMIRVVGNPPEVPGEPREATIARLFGEALLFASQQDASQYDPTKPVSQTPYEVVLDSMAYLMTKDVSAEDMRALLHALPPAELMKLANVNDVVGHGTINRADMVKFAGRAAGQAQDGAWRRFSNAVDDAATWRHDPETHRLADAPGLIDNVIKAANELGRFQFLGGKVDGRTYLATQAQLGGVLALLAEADNLSTATKPQLDLFAKALATLQFAGDFGIAAEEARRAQLASVARSAVSGQLINALRDTSDKQPIDIVRAITQAIDQRAASGLKPHTLADELRALTMELPPATRAQLRASMSSDKITRLGAVLTEVARVSQVKEFVALSRELDEIASVLAAVRDAVSPDVNTAAEGRWPAIAKLGDELNPDMRAVLSSFCISVHEGELTVTIADVPVNFQTAVDAAIRSIKVTEPAAPFALDASQGAVTVNLNATDQAALVDLAGGNPRLLSALSRVLSGPAWEGVDELLETPDTPFRMGRTPVQYLGEPIYTYDVCSDNRGGLIVTRTLSLGQVRKARLLQPGAAQELDVHMMVSPKIVTKVAISATGLANPLGSAQVSSQFSVVEWERDYPRPLTVNEIMAPGTNPALREEFESFVRDAYVGENFDFLAAMNDFDAQPTRAMAKVLEAKFIAQDAPNQVNLNSELRQAIHRALSDPNAKMSAGDLVAVFAPARHEITKLLEVNQFDKFRNRIAPMRRPTPDAAVASAAEIPQEAGESNEQPDRTRVLVGNYVGALTRPLLTQSNVDTNISRIIRSMPKDPESYWGNLNEHVISIVRTLDPTQIASLLINLSESTYRPYAGHVELLRKAAQDRLNETNERVSRMTPEGILAESAKRLPSAQLQTWFESGRITAYELFTALKEATAAELRTAAQTRTGNGQFQLIARRVIQAQTRELDSARVELVAAFARQARLDAPVNDASLPHLAELAKRLVGYTALVIKLGDPSAGADREIERERGLLAARLTTAMENPAPGLTSSEVSNHRDALDTLGVSTAVRAAAVGKLRARETAERSRLPSQGSQRASQTRIPPRPPPRLSLTQGEPLPPPEMSPTGGQIPPPPDDDIPPPPDDPHA
ncbi:hypothetical protein [Caenimonas koreensis]|uniref:hypothetical protein n=1 Tax=Caenimonas koreensis TaxID=367474 RepID=UPI0037833131